MRTTKALVVVAMCVGVLSGCGTSGDDKAKDDKDDKAGAAKPAAGTTPDPKPAGDEPAKIDMVDVTLMVDGSPPGLEAKDFVLNITGVTPPANIKPSKVVKYIDSGASTAMIVIVQGDERWMGNETHLDEEDPDRMEGAFQGVAPAIDALASALPPGSKTAVLTYNNAVHTRKPLDETPLSAAALGTQKDYFDTIGSALVSALSEAWALLAKDTSSRKVVVVFGDGEGQRENIDADIDDAVEKFHKLDAEVFTRTFTAIPTTSPVGMQNMEKLGYTGSRTAVSRDELVALSNQVEAVLGSRYYVTFRVSKDDSKDRARFELQAGLEKVEFSVAR